MKITNEIRNIKTVLGLSKYIKGFDHNIQTVQYADLYWITLGDKDNNLFITVDFTSAIPRVNVVERRLSSNDTKNTYELGGNVYLPISNRGKSEFIESVFNEIYSV